MNLLAQASQVGYDPSGTPEIYTSQNPFVRNTSSILPGVDLTSIPVVGRGILISPTTVMRAWHNGQSQTGEPYTFVEQDGTVHTRTQISRSDQLGQDLVVHVLDQPLPPSINPMQIFPSTLPQYLGDVRPYCYRVTYTNQHVLSLGDFVVETDSAGTRIDQDEITGNNHWVEAVGGDSGGAIFLVLDGIPFALAATLNVGEEGSASHIHSHLLTSEYGAISFDLRRSIYNSTPPEPQGEGDQSTIFIRRR